MSHEPTDVMIAAYYDTEPAKLDYTAVMDADTAVGRALEKAVGEADGKRVAALEQAMAEAQQKMQAPAR